MNNDVVPVEIRAIRPDRSWYALYLGAESKVFVMVVESHVGAAIERYLFGQKTDRPLTHDLMQLVFKGLGVSVERVVISEVKDSVYYARLILQQDNELGRKVVELDARPSDCLALATALKRPIFVTRTVLDEVNDQSDTLERSSDWESQQE